MKYQHAKKLHNEDEVTVKETGEVVRVIKVSAVSNLKKPTVFIEAVDNNGFWKEYMHTEIS